MRIRIIKWADRLLDEVARPASFMMKAANNWKAILGLYVFTILGGAAVFSIVEDDRSLWDGIWWACITGLSIGYGDIYPATTAGRVTGIVLAHVILLAIVPMIIAQITLKLIRDNDKFTDGEQEEIKAELDLLVEGQEADRAERATILHQQSLIMAHLGVVDSDESPR